MLSKSSISGENTQRIIRLTPSLIKFWIRKTILKNISLDVKGIKQTIIVWYESWIFECNSNFKTCHGKLQLLQVLKMQKWANMHSYQEIVHEK